MNIERTPRHVRTAIHDWVVGLYDWTNFATFTFDSSRSIEGAKKTFYRYVRGVARDFGHVPFLVGVEPHVSGDAHLHALLAMPRVDHAVDPERIARLDIEMLKDRWKRLPGSGVFIRVDPFDPSKGQVGGYITKQEHWHLNVACPGDYPCHRRCQVARGPLR